MERLKQLPKSILINTMETQDVGLYKDRKKGRLILLFKKHGLAIAGDTYTTFDQLPAASGTLNSALTVSKSCTDPGIHKGVFIELTGNCPCSECDWPFALSIKPKVRFPGVDNSRSNYARVTYGDELGLVECTGGTIDDSYLRTAENNLITQIANDTGLHGNDAPPLSNQSGAVVYAYKAVKVTIDAGGVADVDITIDGTTTSIALETAGIGSADNINDDTTVQAYVRSWAISTTEIIIMSRINGQLFTVADGASGTGTLTVDNHYIALVAKNEEVSFDVEFEKGFATVEKFSLYHITGYTVAGTTILTVDGTATGASTDTAAAETNAAALNAVLATASITDVYCSGDDYAAVTIVYANEDVDYVTFTFSAASTSSVSYYQSHLGKWPRLTSDDVFREFAASQHMGALQKHIYSDQPIDGEEYCVYKLKGLILSDAVHGPNKRDYFEHEVEVWVRKAQAVTDVWDNTDLASVGNPRIFMQEDTVTGYTPDTNFEELLGYWCGLAVTSW